MKTENLTIAAHSVGFLVSDLRKAHSDAIASGNRFAEIAILAVLGEAVALKDKITALVDAAGGEP